MGDRFSLLYDILCLSCTALCTETLILFSVPYMYSNMYVYVSYQECIPGYAHRYYKAYQR